MSVQNELPIGTPGELLANARLKQGCSLDEVAGFLKLSVEKVEAMEADQWGQLAAVYCKGSARRYAGFLGLNAVEFESALDTIKYTEPPVKSIFSQIPSPSSTSMRGFRVLSYLVATTFVVLPLVLAYTHFAVRWSQDEPLLTESTSNVDYIQAATLPANPNGSDNISILDIELSADSWVSVTDADGRQLDAQLRKGGQVYRYQGKPPFQLQIGRVSATRVRLDGDPVDLSAFTSGDIANLEVGVSHSG
ncbi:MAG: helix-turn-helix domain-containing protein [Xanthomonadales bacterium]|nr:helix-turn-helix domain-containing protein [Xanthomonadales bacterium]